LPTHDEPAYDVRVAPLSQQTAAAPPLTWSRWRTCRSTGWRAIIVWPRAFMMWRGAVRQPPLLQDSQGWSEIGGGEPVV